MTHKEREIIIPVNSNGLKIFEEKISEIERLFAEIYTRRKNSNISLEEAYFALESKFNLNAIPSQCNSSAVNVISPLEDIYGFERVVARPHHRAGNSTDGLTMAKRYAFRESSYLNYLGFNKEVDKFFKIFSAIEPSLVYVPNNIKTSPKVKTWLRKTKMK